MQYASVWPDCAPASNSGLPDPGSAVCFLDLTQTGSTKAWHEAHAQLFRQTEPMVQSHAMDADLQPVVTALVERDDGQLLALIETLNGVPQVAPRLLAWIEAAADMRLAHAD